MTNHGVVARLAALARRLPGLRGGPRLPRAMGEDAVWTMMVRYCAREAPATDVARVEGWCAEAPERERLRRGLLRTTAVSREAALDYRRQAAWEQLVQRIEVEESRPARVRPMFIGANAGAIRADTGVRRSTRRRRTIARASIVGVAALLLAAVALQRSGLIALRGIGAEPAPAQHEYVASRGERIKIDLADGSSVTLGPASRLRVEETNFAHARVVHLDGMAHFAVAHDRAHPFVVYAAGAAVQAVGTAFTVRAYPTDDSAAQVVVNRGRVLLRSARAVDGTGTVLDSGDLGRRSGAGVVSVTRGIDLDRYLGWMSGQLSYDQAPARDIARDLERWYDLTIVIDDSALAETRVNGYFDRGRTADQTMTLFASILGATYERRGDRVLVGVR
jgi:transmembrane sensor